MKLTNASGPQVVTVTYITDGVAQEPVESFTIMLVPAPGLRLPKGPGVFFRQLMIMNIQDRDSKQCVVDDNNSTSHILYNSTEYLHD